MNPAISSEVNYLGPMEDYPVAFSYNRPASNLVFDPREVDWHDVRSLPDAREMGDKGFMLAQIPFDYPAGDRAEDHVDALRNATSGYLQRLTGAAKIVMLGPFIRHSDPELAEPGKTPAYYIHGDYTAISFARSAAEMLRDDPDKERLLAGRMAIYQTWPPLSPPPQESVLTVLDRTTLHAQDVVDGTVVVGTADNPRPHPALLFRYDPRHKWYYVSRMEPGDTLVFLGFDSADAALPGCPHTAFANCAPDAVPRISAEMRAFVFWG